MSQLIIGITGGIGTGKTAVTDYLAKQGITIVDADIIAREVVEPNEPALTEIAKRFGGDILLESGALNRSALREIIFNNPQEKQWLEQLLHPLINQRLRQYLTEANSAYSVLVSPLLLETSQKDIVDRIMVIDADEAIQIKRATQRDHVSVEQIKKIIASQMPREQKHEYADDIVNNNDGLEELHKQVEQLHQTYLKLAHDKI